VVWDREALADETVTGPAIIEEAFATHYIATGWQARLGDAGAIIAGRTP
jgi:N-methylhydantoinase A